MAGTITWPADCTLPRERTEFCYCLVEKLRLLHNALGAQVGGTLDLTGAIYDPVRTVLATHEGTPWTLAKFNTWKGAWWMPKHHRAHQVMLTYRDQLKGSTVWNPDISELDD